MNFLPKALDLVDRAIDLDTANGDLDCLVEDNDDNDTNFKASDNKKLQHENIYNRLLPYDVSSESHEHVTRIKANIAKSIELDQPSTYGWFNSLESFVDLYGLAFSKEDHIYFVKLLYQLMISKDSMDLVHIPHVARCFSKLMRKRYLISSEELVLDWRPLYETYERLLYSETENLGLRFVPEHLESYLSQAIRLSRPHFPIESTQEMLDEWRPMLSPYSVSIQRATTYMNLFLPTMLPPENHDRGFKLWFDEVMQMWLTGKVSSAFYESKFTYLLSRLASDCMGYIDWEPYIPLIFNHFKSSLNLFGGVNRINYRRPGDTSDLGPCVQWMVYMISQENSCLDHISKLFKAIESFYHPSNSDRRWHTKLQQFLCKLPAYYVKRLYRERHKNNAWSKRIPECHRLSDDQTSQFVDALMPVVLTSMFNQAGISSAALAFRDLAVLRPEKVIPPLLDRLYGSYETPIGPHRFLASINCMASIVPAMVRPCKYFREGSSHVVPLLLNSLPGIDSNDMRKCIAVFRFIAALAAHIRMKDYSYLVDQRPELTNEQQQLCLSTSQFEEFVIQFLDKCFILIENASSTTISNLDQDTHYKNGEEGIIEAVISSVTWTILAQASPEIQQAALDKVYSHVTRHIFDIKTRGKAIATLCLACARSSPEEALAKFVPHFSRLILTLTDHDEVYSESILDDELLFSLLLMSEIVRCNSSHILKYKELIVQVLSRALKLTSKDGYMLGCGILRHLVRALTNITCCDWRNIDYQNEANREAEERWPFDNWGHATHISELKLDWEVPDSESRKFAQELLEMFLRSAMQDLISWSRNERKLTRDEVQRSLHVLLSSIIGAASVLPSVDSETIELCPFEVPFIPLYVSNTGTEPLDFEDGTNIRTWTIENIILILDHINSSHQDDTKSLTLICEIFSTAITYYGYNKSELRLATQRIKSMKSGAQNKLLGSKRHSRYLLVEKVAQQHRAMLFNKGQPDFTKLHLHVFNLMFELSQSHYVEVRAISQDTLLLLLNYFPFSETILIPMLVNELRKPEIEHNKFKGLLYTAGNRLLVEPSWTYIKILWPAIVESPHSEQPSIVKLLDRICSFVQKEFDTFEPSQYFTNDIKKVVDEFWSNELIDKGSYERPSCETVSRVKALVDQRNQRSVADYQELVLKFVEMIENPHLHWNRKSVAYCLFSHLMRDDCVLPLPALDLCISSLVSERLNIRVKAVILVAAQLKLHKRKHVKRRLKFSSPIKHIESKAERLSLSNEQSEATGNQEPGEDINTLSNNNNWMQYELTDRNYDKDEWTAMIFVDKPHIGFYDWPRELEIYEPFEKQPKLNRPREELNEHELLIYDKFTDPEFVDNLVKYLCFEDNKGSFENHRFDLKRATLFKGLFRNYGPCMMEPFKKYVLEYSKGTCELKHKFVIEFLAGLLRGSKHWSYEMHLELRTFVSSILDQMTISQENFNDWTGLSNYVFRNRDARRYSWLLHYFVTKATSESESSAPTVTPFIQASRLTIAHHCLMQCEWRAVDRVFPKIIDSLKNQDHLLAYTNVRTSLVTIYSLVYMFDDPTMISRIPGTLANRPRRADFIDFILPKLAILEYGKRSSSNIIVDSRNLTSSLEVDSNQPGTNSKLGQTSEATNESPIAALRMASVASEDTDMVMMAETLIKFRQIGANVGLSSLPTTNTAGQHKPTASNIKAESSSESNSAGVGINPLEDSLRQALPHIGSDNSSESISGDSSAESKERKDALKLMKLTARWVINDVRMKSLVPADFFKLLPVICEMGREADDPELAAHSLYAVALLAISTLTSEAVTESLKCVRKIVSEHSWHARTAASFFIGVMVSSNLFRLINNEEWRSDIEDIVINHLLCDERIEVRESSSLTLSGMIHCEFTKITSELISEFKRRASEPLVRKKQPNGITTIEPKSIVTRHSGILCLCACVHAYPYTVPDYLPDILTLLSDHLTDPQPISTTIKKTMSNFRRTHYDNWQSDKTKFTDDQLCILADLLVSPNSINYQNQKEFTKDIIYLKMISEAIINVGVVVAACVLMFIYLLRFVLRYKHEYESNPLCTTTVIVSLLTVTVLAFLLPIDIFIVSFVKNSDGTLWINGDTLAKISQVILGTYYALYMLIIFLIAAVIPFVHFINDDSESNSADRGRKAIKNSFISAAMVLVLFIMAGLLLHNNDINPDSIIDKISEIKNSTEFQSALNGVLIIIYALGFLNINFYTASGIFSWPIGLVMGTHDTRQHVNRMSDQELVLNARINTLNEKARTRPLSAREIEQLSEAESQLRELELERRVIGEYNNSWSYLLNKLFRPLQITVGLLLGGLATILVTSLVIINFDRIMNGSGFRQAYALVKPTLFNPLEYVFSHLEGVPFIGPLPVIIVTCFMAVGTISGTRNLGLWFFVARIHKIKPRRTEPRALLFFCVTIMLTAVAFNQIMYSMAPEYVTFGNQHYSAVGANNETVVKRCSLADYDPKECLMTRASILLMRSLFEFWIVGVAFYWCSWTFALVGMMSFIAYLVRGRREASHGFVDAADEFEE